LPEDLLRAIDGADSKWSAFVERASRAYLAQLEKARREARDIAILNARAGEFNAEVADVLEYQGRP
jgi:hypothetical protein